MIKATKAAFPPPTAQSAWVTSPCCPSQDPNSKKGLQTPAHRSAPLPPALRLSSFGFSNELRLSSLRALHTQLLYLDAPWPSFHNSFTGYDQLYEPHFQKPAFDSEMISDYLKVAEKEHPSSHIPCTQFPQMLAFDRVDCHTGVLDARATRVTLLPTSYSVTSCGSLEIGHGGTVFTPWKLVVGLFFPGKCFPFTTMSPFYQYLFPLSVCVCARVGCVCVCV